MAGVNDSADKTKPFRDFWKLLVVRFHSESFLVSPFVRKPPLSPIKIWVDGEWLPAVLLFILATAQPLRVASNKVEFFSVALTIVASSVKSPAQAMLLTTFWGLLLASLKLSLPTGTQRGFLFRLSRMAECNQKLRPYISQYPHKNSKKRNELSVPRVGES
jgi:hypothetical protein